ncbi:GNAT family N-acetyltransferase [Thalassobacillus pellis]|uniref:GNAT family N-acetyltransferase n=1 Tax=Thalassobacillus pellis TaxID=748008 RepID=UPI001960781B|nr:GNAT family protein [Thalassobacillus pellis]MBM7554352.1 ribosomal-protein-alanine N-acetyltransferase [Thalassobacillus pellis]
MNDPSFYPFPEFETDRLLLREVEIGDAKRLFEIFNDKNAMEYYGMLPHEDIAETNKLINIIKENHQTGKAIRWTLVNKETGKCIGTCGFHRFDEQRKRAEVGYECHPAEWRKGYMSEALRTILAHGFQSLKLHRIEGIVDGDNTPSKQLLLKLGFTYEGCMRERFYFRERYFDEHYYGLLSPEGEYK